MPETNHHLTWTNLLTAEKEKKYFKHILHQIAKQRLQGKIIYPPDNKIFEAFRLTPLSGLKVVILGQDPYHGPDQAHGLCFSVLKGVRPPPSLQNIFKELHDDLGCTRPPQGRLDHWAKQGVLLLNTMLSVEAGKPQSHANLGWEQFTDRVISLINENCQHVVFLLWGSNAQKKFRLLDTARHTIFKAPHPSPLSSYRGFFGCQHFSKCNKALLAHQQNPVAWCLPEYS